MTRLVIGTNKAKTTPALVKEVGIIPSGTIDITQNGIVDVTNYANANVNTPAAPERYVGYTLDADGTTILDPNQPVFNFSGVKTFTISLREAYQNRIDITSVDCHSIEVVKNGSFYGAFRNCTNLTTVDFSGLLSVSSSTGFKEAFKGCTSLTTVLGMVPVYYVLQNSFDSCFEGCTSLTGSFTCPAENFPSYCFRKTFKDTNITSLYFTGCRYDGMSSSWQVSQYPFDDMLSGVTGCTVHFPTDVEDAISSWASVIAGFGGTNTVILYDLPVVKKIKGANSNNFFRAPYYDTSTALCWGNSISGNTGLAYDRYYTSGTEFPTVGATVYRNAACTTSYTTVSEIY